MNICKHSWQIEYNEKENKEYAICRKCGLTREVCIYCEKETSSCGSQIYHTPIDEIGYFELYKEDSGYSIVFDGAVGADINFCPVCGRKLKEE